MKETRYFFVPDAVHQQELPPEEAMHAMRVLRLKGGDEIFLMDGEGCFYRAQVTIAATRNCYYEILEMLPQKPLWQGRLHLAIAPTKMLDRVEWMLEKATEVGIDEVSFLNCAFSERKLLKLPRLEKIVVSAVKQSRKAWKPKLHEMTNFRKFIAAHTEWPRYIAHCYDEIPRMNLFDQLSQQDSNDALVLVGPEGDFSIEEVRQAVDAGFVSVDLGRSRLRTETAGLVAVMMMHLAKQNK